MKNVIAISSAALLISSCVTRDNPLDIKAGDNYVSPSFTVNGLPENHVFTGTVKPIVCEGVNSTMTYRYRLDNGGWTTWQGNTYAYATISDGLHRLYIQGAYPSLEKPAELSLDFSVVTKSNSFYLAPVQVKQSSAQVTLNSFDLKDSLASLHIELTKGTVSDALLKGSDSFTKVLFSGKVVDISVLPSGALITGSRELTTLTITGLNSSDTIGFTAYGETKSGKSVTLNSLVGAVVE